MGKRLRMVVMGLVGALGMAAALALGAGASDIKACVSQSGVVTPAGPTGRCLASQSSMAISGNFFKSTKRGTITINGVAFKESQRGRTITINGTAFKGSRSRRTLTINGNAFRTGTLPNTLTINGNSFRTGTLPNSLTINGNSFRSSGTTLTINGTVFGPGMAAAQGPAGAQGADGKQGPPGPAGSVAPGGAPVEVAGPVKGSSGDTVVLAAVKFSGTEPRRILLTGGFDASCSSCQVRITPGWSLSLDGGSTLVQRRISTMGNSEHVGATVSEILVTPSVCGPCTFNLNLVVPPPGSAGQASSVDATAIRLGLVDLGPVAR